MKAKPGELKAGWNARERDHGWAWGEGTAKADGNLIGSHLFFTKTVQGTSLVKELEARGYDVKTLRFSIRKRADKSELGGTQ